MAEILLGKRTTYPSHYSPEILAGVPRCLSRREQGIESVRFCGADAWHAYELGYLNHNGLPQVGILKMVCPADSPNLVESKSLKLYLNSLNMECFGSADEVATRVATDVGAIVGAEVTTRIFSGQILRQHHIGYGYTVLESLGEASTLEIGRYTETPDLLDEMPTGFSKEAKYCSNLLRSNCKFTRQPDWGSVFIHLVGSRQPTPMGLLSYIVSLRGENHFHEEICELIYARLLERYSPDGLMVACVYTRRGGIDICPVRASNRRLLPAALLDSERLTTKLMRQ